MSAEFNSFSNERLIEMAKIELAKATDTKTAETSFRASASMRRINAELVRRGGTPVSANISAAFEQ